MEETQPLMVCGDCGRPGKYLWGGNDWQKPRVICGLHRRSYLRVYRLVQDEPSWRKAKELAQAAEKD